MTAIPADRVIAGRYALRRRRGGGGMGTVWQAEDQVLHRTVAVKEVSLPSSLDDAERERLQARVLREARTASQLSHPAAVTIFDQVEDGGRTFLVMELVDAPTLTELVKRDGPLRPEQAARIALDVLGALQAAHRAGIVHRDVKPSNIMVPAAGPAKLTDFGIASVQDDPGDTGTGTVLGSPHYMAPEQATGDHATTATDIWGLGATLYFAVEGEPPFAGDTPVATVTSVVHAPARPHRSAGGLGPLLDAMLQKDPAARPADGEVERRLLDLLAAGAVGTAPVDQTIVAPPVSTPPARPAPAPASSSMHRTSPAFTPAPTRTHPKRWPLVAAVLALLVAAAAVVVAYRTLDTSTGATKSTAAAAGSGGPGSVPAGWKMFHRSDAGYTVAYPPNWSVANNGSFTDFREPGTGTYLRIDWTPKASPSAVDAWKHLEGSFAAGHAAYQRVRLEPTTFAGSTNAAAWEFTYTDQGAALHAVDIGFVSGVKGYAFNFQTHADRWNDSQALLKQLEQGFRAGT